MRENWIDDEEDDVFYWPRERKWNPDLCKLVVRLLGIGNKETFDKLSDSGLRLMELGSGETAFPFAAQEALCHYDKSLGAVDIYDLFPSEYFNLSDSFCRYQGYLFVTDPCNLTVKVTIGPALNDSGSDYSLLYYLDGIMNASYANSDRERHSNVDDYIRAAHPIEETYPNLVFCYVREYGENYDKLLGGLIGLSYQLMGNLAGSRLDKSKLASFSEIRDKLASISWGPYIWCLFATALALGCDPCGAGKAAVVVPSKASRAFGEARSFLIESNLVERIIQLPPGFLCSSRASDLIVLKGGRKADDLMCFTKVDAVARSRFEAIAMDEKTIDCIAEGRNSRIVSHKFLEPRDVLEQADPNQGWEMAGGGYKIEYCFVNLKEVGSDQGRETAPDPLRRSAAGRSGSSLSALRFSIEHILKADGARRAESDASERLQDDDRALVLRGKSLTAAQRRQLVYEPEAERVCLQSPEEGLPRKACRYVTMSDFLREGGTADLSFASLNGSRRFAVGPEYLSKSSLDAFGNDSWKKCVLRKGDLVLARTGTNNEVYRAENILTSTEYLLPSDNVLVIRPPRQGPLTSDYIRAFLMSETGQMQLRSLRKGKVTTLSVGDLVGLTAPVMSSGGDREKQEHLLRQADELTTEAREKLRDAARLRSSLFSSVDLFNSITLETVLIDRDNLARFNGDKTVRGYDYVLFRRILAKIGIADGRIAQLDVQLRDSESMGPEDVIMDVQKEGDRPFTAKFFLKGIQDELATVKTSTADSIADALDRDNGELRRLINEFQAVGAATRMPKGDAEKLRSELAPYLDKLYRWVLTGSSAAVPGEESAECIITCDARTDINGVYTVNEYIEMLVAEDSHPHGFGTIFQWTCPPHLLGKEIQLEGRLIP